MRVTLSKYYNKGQQNTPIKKWYVLYTKPRHEIKVNERLQLLGIDSYCPVVIKVSQWSDRKKKIKSAALPSMVLVYMYEHERSQVFDCPGVIRYMFYNKKIVSIPQHEVDLLKNYLEGKCCLKSTVTSLNVGQQLMVDQFQNCIGEVVKVTSNRLWVNIQSLNLKVSLDII